MNLRRPVVALRGIASSRLALPALLLGLLCIAAAGASSGASAPVTQTFAATGDAYVASNKASTNYGTDSKLRLSAAPVQRGYLSFNPQGLVGTITRATLRLYAQNGSPIGFDIRSVTTGWSESTITYNNSPVPSATVTGSSGAVASGQWVGIDVTKLVTGNGAVSFAPTTTDNSTIMLASRESGASTAPQLVVETTTDTPPVNTNLPAVSGTAQEGQSLSASPGTWSGTAPISYAYQWRRCDSGGAACTNIAGATTSAYTLVTADVGSTVRVAVTGSNSAGSSTASSPQTTIVSVAPPTPPANTSAPTIGGTAQEGQSLSASPGTWTGTAPISYAYQWRRCDTSGAGCADIGGATSNAYALVTADVGSTVRVAVTGSNSAGSSSASSSQTAVVIAAPTAPANTSAPTVSGTAQEGQSLSANPGTWTGTAPIGYAYQWRRCDSSGAGCADIAGATSNAYTLATGDVGGTVRVAVTASNGAGSSSASSSQTDVVTAAPAAPANTSAPTVSGTAQQGQVLSASPGSWTGTAPISFAYQWRRCDSSGAGCTDISGATTNAYTLATGDLGSTIRVAVTGSNSVGSSSASSTQTAVVTGAPANTSAPTISGTAQQGQVLSATTGSWTGTAPISYAYQWHRCDSAGAGCADIAGATTNAYTVATADLGSTIRVAVTGSNSVGSSSASSAQTAVVTGAPANTSAPTITGTAQASQSLTASPGTWTGTAPISYAYQWRRCDSTGVGCADIGGATSNAYTLVTADVGSTIRVAVTGSNSAGSSSASSSQTAVVTAAPTAPANTIAPTVSGTAQQDQTLTATSGTWTGTAPISYAYQWRRCDGGGAGCADISGANTPSYTLGGGDVGSTVRVAVTASNSVGSSSTSSTQTGVVARAPVIVAAGDVACDPVRSDFNNGLGTASTCHMRQTADLISAINPNAVLALGDIQYECAALAAFQQSYNLSWGLYKAITFPVAGNHEYQTDSTATPPNTPCDNTASASGYYDYFGAAAGDRTKGYYSYDVGAWHIITLNAECSFVGGCGAGSAQEQWLRADLATHPTACTIASWHEPRWSSGVQGNLSAYDAFWQDLYAAHAEIVLNGHMHLYERFAPQNPQGQLDATNGIREFTVGTGGKTLVNFSSVIQPNSEVRNNNTYGVLKLTLHPTSYDWAFVPEQGKTFTDAGSSACH